MSAEVMLLQDQSLSVPVINPRTRQRGVAFGDGSNRSGMELRFVAANADVQAGDELVTSGLDGVYPPGIPVARVLEVERQAETSFARIDLVPMANANGRRHVLVLPVNRGPGKGDENKEPAKAEVEPRPVGNSGRGVR